MKVVAVTACPTGVAHTYLAQTAIEKECKKRGYDVQVETQGSMGVENELEQTKIDAADMVILAIAIRIDGEERFENKAAEGKVIKVEPSFAIKKPAEVLDKAEKAFENVCR